MPAGESHFASQTPEQGLRQDALPRSVASTLATVRELALKLDGLHQQDRLHLRISFQTATWNDQGQILLPPPQDAATFGGEAIDEELCPLALRTPDPLSLPTRLPAARRVLQEALLTFPPEAIDLYQLSALLCRLLTGEPISSYLRSPKTKSRVPPEVQEVIERGLGHEELRAFHNLTEFAEALAQFDFPAENTPHSFNPASAEDTAPSIFSRKPDSDTSLVKPSSRESSSPGLAVPYQRLGHYEIQERIGQGGMGQVYKGYERTLDRTVAIKVLSGEFSRSENFVRRFYAEATAAAKLRHPNIVQIYYIGEDQGQHFFAMQYIQGESLAHLLAARGKLGLDESVSILQQALSGLAAAHKLGLIHRDIKPGNILLDGKTPKAYLADFGLVKSLEQAEGLTATGTIMGTVDYISPEQGRGLPVDPRADLYSLGVVMFRMLSGRLPFEADSPTSMIFQHVYETAPPLQSMGLGLPASYSSIVEKLLAKDPEERYASAEDVLLDLKAAQENQPLHSFTGNRQGAKPSPMPVGQKSPPSLGTTQLIAVPDFGASPALPRNLNDVAPTGWWPRLQNQFLDYVSQQAPELYNQMQTTHQQVDRAVAGYERRERKLRQLAQEAQSALGELARQLKSWEQAATTDGESGLETPSQSKAAIVELETQIAQQQEQREEILRQLRQVEAKRAQLSMQRDLLNARLKVAQARLEVAGGRPTSRQRHGIAGLSCWVRDHAKLVVGGAFCLILLLMIIGSFRPQPSPDKLFQSQTASGPAVITNSLGMSLTPIPSGEFLMGSTPQQRAEASRIHKTYLLHFSMDEHPQHLVQITKPFFLGQHEVTRKQFAAFVKDTGHKTQAERHNEENKDTEGFMPKFTWRDPLFVQEDDHPVVCVSWNDAVSFCQWLSRKEGVTYRLPTEAEWEYACKAGANTQYQNGDDPEKLAELGNVADATLKAERALIEDLPGKGDKIFSMAISAQDGYANTAPVGSYRPNAFNLYDMHGNVSEWCSDWYGPNYYERSSGVDPEGPLSGEFRVFRGCAWMGTPGYCRMSNRSRQPQTYFNNKIGFRVVREAPAN